MSNEELRTWLGLRLADLLVYLSFIPLGAMFFIDTRAIEIGLAVTALLLSLAACVLGMKSSPKVSRAANAIKKFAYPFAVCFVLLVIAVHSVRSYRIPQDGMYPGLPAGSRLLAVRRPYHDSTRVSRGDIVVFDQMVDGTTYQFIWRVVGLPGDTIETSRDALIVNGEQLRREESRRDGSLVLYQETNGIALYEVAYDTAPLTSPPPDRSLTVPEGHFFVMVDNRNHAMDSRDFGPIRFESIVGKKW